MCFISELLLQVEVQMFQLYRDGLDDLLKEPLKKPKQGEDEKKPPPLKITLAEHSPTGLVIVSLSLFVCIFEHFDHGKAQKCSQMSTCLRIRASVCTSLLVQFHRI